MSSRIVREPIAAAGSATSFDCVEGGFGLAYGEALSDKKDRWARTFELSVPSGDE